MKSFLVFVLTVSIQYLSSLSGFGQSLHSSDRSLNFKFSFVGDNINNLSGGIKTGSRYLGMASVKLDFDLEKAGLLKGGQFFIHAVNTHGSLPSSELLGDMQVASNIQAGNHTYIQELWYKQTIQNFELTAGVQDLNIEFANSEHGALFLNSSFGILPIISSNIPAPVFPLTTLGLTAKWNISGKISWINALYDGHPTDFDYNPYNVKWQLINGDGILAITELQFPVTLNGLPGIVKAGTYSHSHIIEKSFSRNFPDSLNNTILGFYSYSDQKVWSNGNRNAGIFTQLGYSPGECTNSFYLGIGMNYTGLWSRQGKDVLGFAIASEHFRSGWKSETVLELTYRYQINNFIFIQPDIQYIMNPAGTGETLDNSFTGNFRLGLNL